MQRFEWLKSPWTIGVAMVTGVLIGVYAPDWALSLAHLGRIYITFLIMCVPAIMLTAVTSGLARLVSDAAAGRHLRRMLVVFAAFMLTVSTVVAVVTLVVRPGSALPAETRTVLGRVIQGAEQAAGTPSNWADLLFSVVPGNIFAAFVESNYPQILFVSVLLGLLVGFARLPGTEQLLQMADTGFQMFQLAISWSTYVLPLAIMGIVSGHVARTGFVIVVALAKLLGVGLVLALTGIVAGLILVARVQRMSLGQVWAVLRRPIMLGFGTSNSLAAMPVLMDALGRGLGLPYRLVGVVVPMAVLIARNANVMYATMMLMFAGQLYGISMPPGRVSVLILATVFGTIAGAGMPTIPFLATLTAVAQPMAIPIEAVIPVFVAIMPVLDPFGTAASVALQGAASAIIIGKPVPEPADPQQQTADPAAGTPTAS